MSSFGSLIYTPEQASGEAISKVETHAPKMDAPDEVKAGEPLGVKISVGPHPNTIQHSMRWIEVYYEEEGRKFNPVYIAKIDPAPEYADPEITLSIKLKGSGTLYALGYCNLHGLWETRKKIRVV